MAGEIANFFSGRDEQRISELVRSWSSVERARPEIIAVGEARPPSALPAFTGSGQRSTSREPFKQGPDWFVFQPGDRWLQIGCPQCDWEDIWDRGEEQAPPKCPSCGFGARS